MDREPSLSETPVVSFRLMRECPFRVVEVPFPEASFFAPDEAVTNEREILRRHWEEGGSFFRTEFERFKNWKRLIVAFNWQQEEFTTNLGKVAEMIRRAKSTVALTRATLDLGDSVDKDQRLWRFTQLELLQLIVGSYARIIALERGERLPKREVSILHDKPSSQPKFLTDLADRFNKERLR